MDVTPRCPLCRALVSWDDNPHRPFCSERCWLIDLGAWASEQYRIPVQPVDTETSDDDAADESDST